MLTLALKSQFTILQIAVLPVLEHVRNVTIPDTMSGIPPYTLVSDDQSMVLNPPKGGHSTKPSLKLSQIEVSRFILDAIYRNISLTGDKFSAEFSSEEGVPPGL